MMQVSPKKLILGVVLSAAVFVALIVSWQTRRRPGAVHGYVQRPNVIVISLDTLRADRLGLYGYNRPTSPWLDRFAERAAVFEHAISASSWTLPSHVSLFTGRFPSSHGVRRPGNAIPKDVSLLAEQLREQGYRTFGFHNGGYLRERFGFSRGFDRYEASPEKRVLDERGALGHAVDRAKTALRALSANDPYFLFLHTYDIHCPFAPPEPYRSMFSTDGREKVDSSRCLHHSQSHQLTPGQVQSLSDRYDGSIRWTDAMLQSFFDWLENTPSFQNTYVFIISDHGEEFFEHGSVGHRNSVYRELVHIPFLVAGPGIEPRRIDSVVSLTDVMPTVLDLIGIRPPKNIQGHSLRSSLLGASGSDEIPNWRLVESDYKLTLRSIFDVHEQIIRNVSEGTVERYDLKTDPAEKNNLHSSGDPAHPKLLELDNYLASMTESEPPATEPGLEEREKLESLGYL